MSQQVNELNNTEGIENQPAETENVSVETPSVEELTGQITELESQVASLYEKTQVQETEIAEQKDKYLRLYADFENFRKRVAKEKIELIQAANESLIVNILPVIDDLERSLKALKENKNLTVENAREGSQLIFNKLYKILEQNGLKPMYALGTDFNMDLHESITQIPAPTEDQKGKVIDEVEKGYLLNDKVIRFAKVVIGS